MEWQKPLTNCSPNTELDPIEAEEGNGESGHTRSQLADDDLGVEVGWSSHSADVLGLLGLLGLLEGLLSGLREFPIGIRGAKEVSRLYRGGGKSLEMSGTFCPRERRR